jgi:hypothetical protein
MQVSTVRPLFARCSKLMHLSSDIRQQPTSGHGVSIGGQGSDASAGIPVTSRRPVPPEVHYRSITPPADHAVGCKWMVSDTSNRAHFSRCGRAAELRIEPATLIFRDLCEETWSTLLKRQRTIDDIPKSTQTDERERV